MGIAGELVRSVFSKGHSTKNRESNVRSNAVDKRRWSSVRAYLCGDELKSVLEEEDFASARSSEATVTQPLGDCKPEKGNIQNQEPREGSLEEDDDRKLKQQREAAAFVIQSAFRSFMVRQQLKAFKSIIVTEELLKRKESPSRVSMGTSVEVQTGNSVGVVSIQEESTASHKKMQHKRKPQMFEPKEEWDDSTVDSNVSKLRAQNRMEAMTRRERALAYAFSQQLRLCSKRKQTITEGTETNISWSWLERWMATRLPEGSSAEGQLTKHLGTPTDTTRPIIQKRFLDISFEEKESCGSNEVPVQIDRTETPAAEGKERFKSITARNPVSRRRTVPINHSPKDRTKANKKDSSREAEKDKRQKAKQVGGNKKENSCKDHSSELSVEDQAVDKSNP